MTLMIFALALLWVVVLGLIVALFALSRQIGMLHERISPLGALVNESGPKIGDVSPRFALASLNGGEVAIGPRPGRSTLVFFLSPTCPICKKLLPVLRSVREAERPWLDVVLASDGEEDKQRRFIQTAGLTAFAYVNSTELGLAYRVSRLPFAVLLGEDGTVLSKGLVNSREHLESLITAHEMGVVSVQDYLAASKASKTSSSKSRVA